MNRRFDDHADSIETPLCGRAKDGGTLVDGSVVLDTVSVETSIALFAFDV